jgi:putative ABC transport system permease protein
VTRAVPLARRNLMADRRRLTAATFGVGLAVMLMLLLDGLWAGIESRVTVYQDNSGARLYVAQAGTRNFFGGVSTIPVETVGAIGAMPAVEWAVPVRGLFTILDLHGQKVPAYLIGSIPGERGGPWAVQTGRPPVSDDEVVVGRALAKVHGLGVGDAVEIQGGAFNVVGIDEEADSFMASFVFITHAASDQLLQSPGTTSFVLVGTDEPTAVADAVTDSLGLAVLDRDELRRNDLALLTRSFGVPLRLMTAVAFGAGSLVIALTSYSAIAERRREYGIVKAMGASRTRLTRLALAHSLALALLGVVTGGVLFLAGRGIIMSVRPQFAVVATTGSVARAAIAALAMGLIAAVVPARRLAALEPAAAYRGG